MECLVSGLVKLNLISGWTKLFARQNAQVFLNQIIFGTTFFIFLTMSVAFAQAATLYVAPPPKPAAPAAPAPPPNLSPIPLVEGGRASTTAPMSPTNFSSPTNFTTSGSQTGGTSSQQATGSSSLPPQGQQFQGTSTGASSQQSGIPSTQQKQQTGQLPTQQTGKQPSQQNLQPTAESAGTVDTLPKQTIDTQTQKPGQRTDAATVSDMSTIEKSFGETLDSAQKSTPQKFEPSGFAQFGYSFFRPDSFAPQTDIPVGDDYVVGPGDSIVLTVWGSLDGTHNLEVNRSGEVTLPNIGNIKIAGSRFSKLQDIFRAHISKVYKDFQLTVNIGRLRHIKVYLVGEVRSPGDYNISSMATLINALAAAGGPTRNGTLRNIQIKRNGILVDTVDLYDFFLNGDKSRDIRLQGGDTILVPTIGHVVGIAGTVRRSAIYELKGNTTLKELIDLAGGLLPTTYLQRIQIIRTQTNEKVYILDKSIDPHDSGKSLAELLNTIELSDQDMVKIFPIDRTQRGYVRLNGYVLRPGDYAFKPNLRVADLLMPDNLLPEYNTEYGKINRLMPPDFHPEVIIFNLKEALANNPVHNHQLQEFDDIRIYNRWELEEMPIASISGEVQNPGTFRLTENMTVRDLLVMAGNPRLSAYLKNAEIKRYDFSKINITPYSIYINLEEAIKGDPKHNIRLQKHDEIVIKKWFAREEYPVFINGEVRAPGNFRYVDGMTLRDLVIDAGNLKFTAFLKDVEINRRKIEGSTISTFPINVNLEEAMSNVPNSNIALQPFDTVVVRKIPDWTEEVDRYITLKGEFVFPGTYPIFKGERLSTVIKRAGGFTRKAYLYAAKFVRASVREQQQKRMDQFLFTAEQEVTRKTTELTSLASTKEELESARATLEGVRNSLQILRSLRAEGRVVLRLDRLEKFAGSPHDLEVMGGDVLEVPQSSRAVSVLGRVVNPTNFIGIKGHDVKYYLGLAGGTIRDSDDGEIYVIRADGSIFSRQQYSSLVGLFGHGFMAERVADGDTIVVPQRFESTPWMRNIKDITTILSQLAITGGTVLLGLR